MHGIVKILIEFFALHTRGKDFKWENLSDEEKKVFITKDAFETVVREYQIYKQNS